MQNVEHQHHHQKSYPNILSASEKLSAHASMDGSDEQYARLALLRESHSVAPDRSTAKAKSPHEIVRRLYYIDQLNDRHLRGHHHTFACGPTSLTMALADHCAINPHTGKPTVHQPPTEQDRIGIITATGTMAAGEWVGGPNRMAVFAKQFGLNAQAYSSNNLDTLTRCLEEGNGAVVDGHCLRSGHAHYVYVAGKDSHGYIMGDPASPSTTHWSAAHLQAFMTGYGFTAVWNKDALPGERLVADVAAQGGLTAQAVPHQASGETAINRRRLRDVAPLRTTDNRNFQSNSAHDANLPAISLTSYHGTASHQEQIQSLNEKLPVAPVGYQSIPVPNDPSPPIYSQLPAPVWCEDSKDEATDLDDFQLQGFLDDDRDQFLPDRLTPLPLADSTEPENSLLDKQFSAQSGDFFGASRKPPAVDATLGSSFLAQPDVKSCILPSISSAEHVHQSRNAFTL